MADKRKKVRDLPPSELPAIYGDMDNANQDMYGVKLGNIARANKYTLEEVADYMGVSIHVVIEWYRGRIGMSRYYVNKTKLLLERLG